MRTSTKLLAMALVISSTIPTLVSSSALCPGGDLKDQYLYYLSDKGPQPFHADQVTDKIPLDEKINFIYVLDKTRNAAAAGAILIKRVYDIPNDSGDVQKTMVLRRNKEKEISQFPTEAYQSYHQSMDLTTIELHRGFHASYTPKDRTDDSATKRNLFLYPESVMNSKRQLAKPLILTWNGFGNEQLQCLNFNLNEGEGAFNKIELFIYEIQSRQPQPEDQRRVVHLTIIPPTGH